MYARVHTLGATPEQYERGLEIIRDDLLPYAKEADGFRGLIGLVDRANGQSLVITLWADEETFSRSSPAGQKFSRLTADATGATLRSLDEYEVALFEGVAPTAAAAGDVD